MISRPSFPIVALTLAGLLIVTYLAFGPFPETLWRRIDPTGHALARIRHAQWFTVPYLNDVLELEEPVRSWRVLAHDPSADSLFVVLHRTAQTVPGRLYAIVGLALADSNAAAESARVLAGDTTVIHANLECTEPGAEPPRRANELAILAASPAFARVMRDGNPACP